MSVTHFWSGASALKSCSSRFGATGRLWLLLVVALNFRAALARQPLLRMLLATRLWLTGLPSACRLMVRRGDPARPFSASNKRLMSADNRRVGKGWRSGWAPGA